MFGKKKIPVNTDISAINELLTRGVEEVFVKEHLIKRLQEGKPLRIKLGMDPTSPHIHIGRAVVLRKLGQFQKMGHTVIFLVGDFTARVGDASDKLSKRPMLTAEQINENLKKYKEQVGKIIDLSTAEFQYNSTWLSKLSFTDVAELAECFSVQQMLARRNFAERIEKQEEISLREFLYPLMQGYDSVPLKADIELGGFDQLFNLKAGRVIQKHYGLPEQDVMTITMLEGTDGRKMSSSWGNIIALTDEPNDMFGKVMAVRDELIIKYFTLCTDRTMEEIQKMEVELKNNALHPKKAKQILAVDIVTLYHGKEVAEKALQNFETVFSKKSGIPDDIQTLKTAKGTLLIDLLVENKIIESRGQVKRLIDEGAVSIYPDKKVTEYGFTVTEDVVVKVGKHVFVKMEVK